MLYRQLMTAVNALIAMLDTDGHHHGTEPSRDSMRPLQISITTKRNK